MGLQPSGRTVEAKVLRCSGFAPRAWNLSLIHILNHYSASQFDTESIPNLNIDDAFLQEAAQGEYCFVEDAPLASFEKWIERIVIFRWNRTYPADRYFDLQLGSGQWHLVGTSEFAGHSHDLITMEVYER